jgi:DNA-binding NarL/FixJ family response regulator
LKKSTIVIVDDHPLVREGLKNVITTDRTLEVAGEAGTAREARRMVQRVKPDLVLLDLGLPDMSGTELSREICSRHTSVRVMIVSMHANADYILAAFQSGATGYATKEIAADRLLQGIHRVIEGDYFIDSAVSRQVVDMLKQSAVPRKAIRHTAYNSLTHREQEVLVLLAEGLSARKIADRLRISPKTVDNHRSNIMSKLELRSYYELLRFAVRNDLIDPNAWRG